MVLSVRHRTIRRELLERREQRRRRKRRFRPAIWWWLLLLLLGVIVVPPALFSCRSTIPFTGLGESWPATTSLAGGGIEDQDGASPFASPSSLNGDGTEGESLLNLVVNQVKKHDESSSKHAADSCMQPHCSPSGGGKTDQGVCIGDVLARQPVVDSLADATIHHGWLGGQSIFLLSAD